jgi:hypothetical protein
MLRKSTSQAHNVLKRPFLWAKVNRNTLNPGELEIPLDKHYSNIDKVNEISGPGSACAWRHERQPD